MFRGWNATAFLRAAIEEFEDKSVKGLQYLGEEFMNKARSIKTYTDRTGNLRSSIGYIILRDGRVVDQRFEMARGKGPEGPTRALEFAEEVATSYPDGYVLIGVAGMHYAAYVEANGYDVISGSAPVDNDVSEFMKKLLE